MLLLLHGRAGRQATASKIWRTTLVVSAFFCSVFSAGVGTHSCHHRTMGFYPFFFHNQRKHRTRRCLNVYKRRLRMIRLLNLEVTEVRNTAHGPRRLLREAKGTLIMRHARSKVTNFGYESLKRVEYGVCLLPPIKF